MRPQLPLWARRQGLFFLALVGSYLPNAMFQDMSLITMVNSLLFFMAGIIVGLESWTRPAEPLPIETPS